jgi:hypothetical protein|uniref:Uncharacterized protein n=1 Tax=Picea glauca TaxID=3330 RepID=A0A101LXF7_PICGL|nr:hypothetical protein ABT39_MTgene6137 [Picea glauca]
MGRMLAMSSISRSLDSPARLRKGIVSQPDLEESKKVGKLDLVRQGEGR